MNTSGTIDSILEVPHIYLSCNSTCNIISDRMYGKLLLLSSDPNKYSLNALSTTYRISCAHNGIDLKPLGTVCKVPVVLAGVNIGVFSFVVVSDLPMQLDVLMGQPLLLLRNHSVYGPPSKRMIQFHDNPQEIHLN